MNDSPSTSTSSPPSSVSTPQPAAVQAVALKLPSSWPIDPLVWFAQVKAQFLTRKITCQSTQYAYVISSLPPDIAQEIRDLLMSPPTENQYDVLKGTLIKRTSASEQKMFHQLLISDELGDRKPSHLLRKMYQLLGDKTLEEGFLPNYLYNDCRRMFNSFSLQPLIQFVWTIWPYLPIKSSKPLHHLHL